MPFPVTRRRIVALAFAALLGLAGQALAQEACLKGCAYPPYPGLLFTLGDGFVAKGGEEVKVTHMGFLGSVYNNDGITPRKVGVPDYIGELYVIDPVTGQEKFLFQNQSDWVTHANDSGKMVSLGVYPKGAPVVFKYVNVDGKTNGYKTFPRYSGDNLPGTYDFNADPVLRTMAINGRPKPVSGGSWNWEGKNYTMWCVAADVPGTGEKQFQFEDADDRIFNDIVFRVSGVALVSETHKLEAPQITGVQGADGNYKVTVTPAGGTINQGATIFYTVDGSIPTFDSTGVPKGTTKVYSGPLDITQTATVKAVAWKPSTTGPGGSGTIRYTNSPAAEATFTIARRKLSAPTANPPGGTFTAAVQVTLSQAEGAKIVYRLCDIGAACPDPDASSPAYAGPFSIATPKVIKAMAIQAPHLNSDAAAFTFSFQPAYQVAGAWYLDMNGDGRIDAAKIDLGTKAVFLPPSVFLEDPFSPGQKREIAGTSLRQDAANPSILWAEFPGQPFAAGTAFATGNFGQFTAGSISYDTRAFPVKDGAGPMALSAEALITLDNGGSKRLTVRFSEPLAHPGADGALPFTVQRGGRDITSSLQVTGVESLGNDTWRYTFASDVFPMPGDSLKATALAVDAAGNASNMASFIRIGGKLPEVEVVLDVSGGGCGRGAALASSVPLAIPLSVIPARPSPAAGGCPQVAEQADCLDCRTREWKIADPRRPEAGSFPAGPEIQVTTTVPFAFDLAFYSTMGEFVNRARGTVSADMLKGVPADGSGSRKVSLRWYPVSEKGRPAGTGAYIVRGTLTPKPGDSPAGGPSGPVPATWSAASARTVELRFGYMRD